MNFDPFSYKYPSRRTLVYGSRGMVCATQPLAAQAGLDMIKKGGSAVDAAVAAAACLTVVEPTSNGIGGDGFALVWSGGKLHGLNSSGYAPALADAEALRARGCSKMPLYGWEAVTVPGAPAAWAELNRRFGEKPRRRAFLAHFRKLHARRQSARARRNLAQPRAGRDAAQNRRDRRARLLRGRNCRGDRPLRPILRRLAARRRPGRLQPRVG